MVEIKMLNDRDLQILKLVSEGDLNFQIGAKLFISEGAVKRSLRKIYSILKVKHYPRNLRRIKAVEIAFQKGLIKTKQNDNFIEEVKLLIEEFSGNLEKVFSRYYLQNQELKSKLAFYEVMNSPNTDIVSCIKADQDKCYELRRIREARKD